jgi:hypothetical protein
MNGPDGLFGLPACVMPDGNDARSVYASGSKQKE